MENQYTSTELFERYLDKALSAEEQMDFELQLNTNPNVANSFAFYKRIITGLALTDQDELQNKIHAVTEDLEEAGFFLEDDIIGDYLEGGLDKLSTDKVECRKKKDIEFVEKIEFEEKLLKGIARSDEDDLLKNIGEVQSKLNKEDFFKEKKPKSIPEKTTNSAKAKIIPLWQQYRAIAAAALLAVVVGLFWLISDRPNYNQLYAASFKKETLKLNPLLEELGEYGMGDTERDRKTNLFDALILYEEQKIPKAISALQNHLTQFPTDADAQFYLSLGYMEAQNFPEAIKWLLPISKRNNYHLQKEAKWYLALSFLKTKGQESKAKIILQEIALNKQSDYQEQAINLLEKW